MLKNILSVLLGYLIGSFLPAYIFGRLKGIDIRQVGQRNAGTANTFFTLGLYAAIPTGIIDLSKGLLSMWVAYKLGASFTFIQIAGFSTILGHVFPFYLRFKGGQGVATSIGILFYYLYFYINIHAIYLSDILFLLVIVLLIWSAAREGPVVGIIVLPLFAYSLVRNAPRFYLNPFLISIITYIFSINLINTIDRKLFVIRDKEFKRHMWRTILRPAAVVFVFYYLNTDKVSTLYLIGSVTAVFLLLDLTRLFIKRGKDALRFMFKEREGKTFSSMTTFLIASFIIILLFKKDIAILSILFLITGDIFSKIFGLSFGKHRIFQNKSVEGSTAFLAGALIVSFISIPYLDIPWLIMLAGSITATIVEMLPMGIDDNFTVGIISGSVMELVKLFLH